MLLAHEEAPHPVLSGSATVLRRSRSRNPFPCYQVSGVGPAFALDLEGNYTFVVLKGSSLPDAAGYFAVVDVFTPNTLTVNDAPGARTTGFLLPALS